MKQCKYKLIKKYPGSDPVGTIVTGYGKDGWYSKGTGGKTYDWTLVVYNPEFWEEVVEKDYEIVDTIIKNNLKQKISSVKRLSDGEVFTVGDKDKTVDTNGSHTIRQFRIKQKCFGKNFSGNYTYDGIDRIWIDWEKNCGGNWLESTEKVVEKDYQVLKSCPIEGTIHSVERLSDGEVFTVGDRVKVYEHGSIKTIETITTNSIRTTLKEGVWFTYDSGSSHMYHAIKQKPQPIFLTHDGKDIFPKDIVWYVNKEKFNYDYFQTHANVTFRSDINAYFLTKEGAEEYIKRNKVLFTTEDGVGIKKGDTFYFVDTDLSISLSNTKDGKYDGRKYFSTFETAEKHVIENKPALSINEFWEITWMPTSGFNKHTYMKNLVKERLNLK